MLVISFTILVGHLAFLESLLETAGVIAVRCFAAGMWNNNFGFGCVAITKHCDKFGLKYVYTHLLYVHILYILYMVIYSTCC